jgi:hypothetical protein
MTRGVVRKVFNFFLCLAYLIYPLKLVGLFQQLEEGQTSLPELVDETT